MRKQSMNSFWMKLITFGCAVLLLSAGIAFAAPYDGELFNYTQPDGTPVQLKLYGDEFYAVYETLDGYTAVRDSSGCWVYADISADGNELIPSSTRITSGGRGLAARGPAHVRINHDARLQKVRKMQTLLGRDTKGRPLSSKTKSGAVAPAAPADFSSGTTVQPSPPSAPTTAVRIGLTLLISFPDRPSDVTISQSQVDDFCNKQGFTGWSNYGSIYDYYYAQSQGRLRYNNVVTEYYTAAHPRSYYTDSSVGYTIRAQELIVEALNALDARGFDFSTVNGDGGYTIDGVNCFYAGANINAWSEGLWPHMSGIDWMSSTSPRYAAVVYQISDMKTSPSIGTFCHENGHMLCDFPDLYDYGTSGGKSYGAGYYSLMALGNGSTPQRPKNVDAYLRRAAGWCDTREISSSTAMRAAVRVNSGTIYRYKNLANSSEYFIITACGTNGWETPVDSGLQILHVDENGWNDYQNMTDTNHYELSIEQADFAFQLEKNVNQGGAGDMFSAAGNAVFNDDSSPDSRWWSGATAGSNHTGTASLLAVQSVGAPGEVVTFILGTNALTAGPTIDVDESNITVRCDYNAPPFTNRFAIWNAGTGDVNYTISTSYTDGSGWMSYAPTSGTVNSSADIANLVINPAGLAAGATYAGTVKVSDTNSVNKQKTISVSLTVNPKPSIKVIPGGITNSGCLGWSFTPGFFNIANTNGGTLRYTVSDNASWLTFNPTNGTVMAEQDTVYVYYNTAGLTAGVYNAQVFITDTSAIVTQATVNVSLTLWDAPYMSVFGNGAAVMSGATSISTTNGTDYGYVDVNVGQFDQNFVITNRGSQTLLLTGTPVVVLGGAHSNDFTVTVQPAATIPAGSSTVFTVRFDPVASGVRTGIVTIANNSTNSQPYTFRIGGISAVLTNEVFPPMARIPAGWYRPADASAGWSVSTTDHSEGSYSLKANTIVDSQIAAIEVTNYFTAGNVSFKWKVSSEASWDGLFFYVDGVNVGGQATAWSGTKGWSNFTYAVSGGNHTLRWAYVKDTSGSGGSDTAWIDEVSLPPSAPAIGLGPTNFSFSCVAGGTASMTGSFTVTNTQSSSLHFSNSWDVGWLTVNPVQTNGLTSGQSATCTVSINVTNFSAGVSNATITINSTNAANAPQTVAVQLTVTNPPPPPSSLPFSETFETSPTNMAGTLGAVDGQHGWMSSATNNVVTTASAHEGSQSLGISTGMVSHAFIDTTGKVSISYWAIPVMGNTTSAVPANASAVFWVNTNQQIMAYSNSSLIQVSGFSLPVSNWNRFDITCDYTSHVWSLSVNGTNVLQNFGFYSSQSAFSGIQFINSSTNTTYLDDVNISNAVAIIPPVYFSLTVNGMTGGSVNPTGGVYLAGSNVQISATASNYYQFAQWSGDLSDTTNPVNVTMNTNLTIQAVFAANLVTNGVPAWWLAQYNLATNDAGALSDTDLDGLPAWQEYIAGTVPTNAASVFQITGLSIPGPTIVRWSAVSGRVYTVYWTSNLLNGFQQTLGTNVPWTGNIFTDSTHSAEQQGFYQIKVRLAP